ncbi:MAG: polyprenyl synthetase family protein [Spirochaetales bacterium]|nr:MAG: polyprenyl synthetase family protein [Spirochaetales bacterium]
MKVPTILRPISNELRLVQAEVESQLLQINTTALSGFQTITERAVNHLFRVHGKYLRPALVLLTAQALNDRYPARPEALVKIAAAVELVHSASLVHDDIIDKADERRGQPSVNSVFGNRMAVLIGDLLYDQVFTLLAELTQLGPETQVALFNLFTSTARKMCLGEIYDDQIQIEPAAVTFDQYLQVIDYKTASLMSCCCQASAIALGANDEDRTAVQEFGFHLGRTYQLVDDMIDQDSVFFDRDRMLARSSRETGLCQDALRRIGDNDGTRRLATITQAVVDRQK